MEYFGMTDPPVRGPRNGVVMKKFYKVRYKQISKAVCVNANNIMI